MCQDSRTEPISICKKYFSKGSYLEYPGGQPPGPPQFIKTRRGSPAFATAPAITAGPAHAREIQKLRLRIKNNNAYAQKYKTVCHGPLELAMLTHKNTILFVTARLKKLFWCWGTLSFVMACLIIHFVKLYGPYGFYFYGLFEIYIPNKLLRFVWTQKSIRVWFPVCLVDTLHVGKKIQK